MSEPIQSLCLFACGPGGGEKFFPLDKERIVIGRSSSCDIIIPDMSISKKHALIFSENGRMKIADGLDGKPSSNGVYVNDARIGPPVVLKEGDVVKLGVLRFEVRRSNLSRSGMALEEIKSAGDLEVFLKSGDLLNVKEEDMLARVASLKLSADELTEIFDRSLDVAMEANRLQRVGVVSRLKQRALKITAEGALPQAPEKGVAVSDIHIGDQDETLLDPELAGMGAPSSFRGGRRAVFIGMLVAAAVAGALIGLFLSF